jgi:chloramphenicol O-acetyltransferase type B
MYKPKGYWNKTPPGYLTLKYFIMRAFRRYFDSTIFANPLSKYLAWIGYKSYFQLKHWGSHLRIDYMAFVRKVIFGKYNYVGQNVFLVSCSLGDFSYIGNGTVATHAKIGKFCSIGPNVKIAPGRHPTSIFVSTHPATFGNPSFMLAGLSANSMYEGNIPVVIGNDVWIGANSIILDGVKFGDGAVVAANSVVTKDVPPYCVVGGSPAKFIKKRFDEEQVELLLRISWWDREEQWLRKNIRLFWDIGNFADFFK